MRAILKPDGLHITLESVHEMAIVHSAMDYFAIVMKKSPGVGMDLVVAKDTEIMSAMLDRVKKAPANSQIQIGPLLSHDGTDRSLRPQLPQEPPHVSS